jgi:hypothetical protein
MAVTWEPTAQYLPRVALERGTRPGFALAFEPPTRPGKRKLQKEMLALSGRIHAYLGNQPSSIAATMAAQQQAVAAMQGASEDERRARWGEFSLGEAERYERERGDLMQRFGGDIEYAVAECQRRGMLTAQEADKMRWEAGSPHWIRSTAAKLEALAKRL